MDNGNCYASLTLTTIISHNKKWHAQEMRANVEIYWLSRDNDNARCQMQNLNFSKHSNETKTNALRRQQSFIINQNLLWLSRRCTSYTTTHSCRPNSLIWFKCVFSSQTHTHTHNNIQFNFIVANFSLLPQCMPARERTKWIDFEINSDESRKGQSEVFIYI